MTANLITDEQARGFIGCAPEYASDLAADLVDARALLAMATHFDAGDYVEVFLAVGGHWAVCRFGATLNADGVFRAWPDGEAARFPTYTAAFAALAAARGNK